MISAYRLVMALFASEAFSGKGANNRGGRWNHKGVPVVYVSSTLPLAALETLIRLNKTTVKQPFVSFSVDIPDALAIEDIPLKGLPAKWKLERHISYTRDAGSAWAVGLSSAVLRVPSSIIPSECNYVLNPNHPEFKAIQIGKPVPFFFDNRLRKKLNLK